MYGIEVRVGDKVYVPCIVKQVIRQDAEYCNCSVETTEPMSPYSSKVSISLNTRQTISVMPVDNPSKCDDVCITQQIADVGNSGKSIFLIDVYSINVFTA